VAHRRVTSNALWDRCGNEVNTLARTAELAGCLEPCQAAFIEANGSNIVDIGVDATGPGCGPAHVVEQPTERAHGFLRQTDDHLDAANRMTSTESNEGVWMETPSI
jgi:hypothetical protein